MKTEKKNDKFVLVQTQAEIEAKVTIITKTTILAEADIAKTLKDLAQVIRKLILASNISD